MRIRIEAARMLTYHTADVVEQLKWHERRAGKPGETAESRGELKRLNRLAAVLTPLAKLYATEMGNAVASEAIQVLGGSGYMKDYPVERHFRDARITNIYEGTTQLQVVGAIGGVRSGVLRAHMDALLAKALKSKAGDLAARVQGLLPDLDRALAAAEAHDKEPDFADLYARWLVSIALDCFLATLLVQQAGAGDERKRVVTAAFLDDAQHRVKAAAAQVEAAAKTLITGRTTIIG
jgi:hypothetical protein